MPGMPETAFVRTGDVDIAYQVVGTGPIDLLAVPGWVSHLELSWELPELARFMDRQSRFSRLIIYDKRGTGLSDRVPGVASIEEHTRDLKAVLDAAGSERAALLGRGDGGAVVANFAALHPERTLSLVLGMVIGRVADDASLGGGVLNPGIIESLGQMIEAAWGDGQFLAVGPTVAHDPRIADWWRRYERSSATPNAAAAMMRSILNLDMRPFLSAIRVPTLVVTRSGNSFMPTATARWVADKIAGSRYLELPGPDLMPYFGDADAILDAIEEFVTGSPSQPDPDRVLSTVLFTDIVGSTKLAGARGDRAWQDLQAAHHRVVRRLITRFGGREIDCAGDGFLLAFDGPTRGVRCAIAIRGALKEIGLEIRAGLHADEVEVRPGGVSGIAVHIGARVSALAAVGEILVTSTVKDLVVGSGLSFLDRGSHVLRGVDGEWRLYRVMEV